MIQAHKLIKSVCFRHILVYNISWGVRSKDQCHMKKNHLNSCCVRRNQNACNNSIVTMHQGLVFSKCSILGFKINGSLIIIGTFHGWLTPHYLIVTEWRISRRIFFFWKTNYWTSVASARRVYTVLVNECQLFSIHVHVTPNVDLNSADSIQFIRSNH